MQSDGINLNHRPIWVDGDVGAVVVYDGAGAVYDFLVTFNLGDDLLLHLQRRKGDLENFINVGS